MLVGEAAQEVGEMSRALRGWKGSPAGSRALEQRPQAGQLKEQSLFSHRCGSSLSEGV